MTVNKKLRLEARETLSSFKKGTFLAFFVESVLAFALILAVLLLERFDVPDFVRLNEKLIFTLAAAAFSFLLLLFRAFNVRLFLSKAAKKKLSRSLFRAAAFELLLFLLKAAILFFCLLPFFLMLFCAVKAAQNEAPLCAVAVMGAFGVSLFLLGAFFQRRFAALLFLAPYLFCTGETAAQSIKKSVSKADVGAEGYLELRRSFWGWFSLCVFVFPAAYVWSYYKLSAAIFAEGLLLKNSENICR